MLNIPLEEFKINLKNKSKEETAKEFQSFNESIHINLDKISTIRTLNVDKIKDISDVRRILKFLDIKVEEDGMTEPNGYDEVRDLFEY